MRAMHCQTDLQSHSPTCAVLPHAGFSLQQHHIAASHSPRAFATWQRQQHGSCGRRQRLECHKCSARRSSALQQLKELQEEEAPQQESQLPPGVLTSPHAAHLTLPAAQPSTVCLLSIYTDSRPVSHAVRQLEWNTPLTVLQYPHPKLRAPNAPVGVFGPELQRLADAMFDVMYRSACAQG